MYASVIVDVSSSNVDYEYEYIIPQELIPLAIPGVRVKVPFGKADRLIMGYIIEVSDKARFEGEAKAIVEILDIEPLISLSQLKLAKAIKKDTYSPLVRILNLMIPDNLRLKTTKYLLVHDFNLLDANLVSHLAGKVRTIYNNALLPYQNAIRKGIEQKAISVVYEANEKGKEGFIIKYIVNKELVIQEKAFIKSNRHQESLLVLLNEPALSKEELIERLGFTNYMIKKFVKEHFLIASKIKQSRITSRTFDYQTMINLAEVDPFVIQAVAKINEANDLVLWIPQTKTEELSTLLLLTINTLKEEKNVLIVCPDILSSYRFSSFLSYHTKLDVACLNSDRTKAELFDYYEAIRANKYQIMVTTLAKALYPFQNIGLIIMFDTENTNYLNEQSPRFDLRVVMELQAIAYKSKLIYHSLIPTLEMYSNALVRQYPIIKGEASKLNYQIKVIDLTLELKQGNRLPLGRELVNALKDVINNNKQALLILNNRGYSHSILCRSCGQVINCPRCQVPLRYHKLPDRISCPICNYQEKFNHLCPSCGSDKIRHIGLGMEKLKEVVDIQIPGAKSVIIDQANYYDFEAKIEQVIDNEVNIIIATDLFARSVPNHQISLIAIIALDIVAKSTSFDAFHQAYSLLTHAKMHLQNENSEMYIQTYDPNMPFLASFIKNDFDEYFKNELKLRELLKVSPIYQINRLLIKAPYHESFKVALNLKQAIKHLIKYAIIIGPVYNKREKAVQLIVKHQDNTIYQVYENLYKTFQNEQIVIIFEKYPKAIS